jgi:hypothetical protein
MATAAVVPRISVVTVTKRPGSIDITWGALEAQTVEDFEWVLCDELFGWRAGEVAEFVGDRRLVHVSAPTSSDHLWNLNKAYNQALRHCRGELVVSLQDYIWIPPDGLERFWRAYELLGPTTFVGGVTATYALPGPVRCLEGKVTIFERPWKAAPTELLRVDEDRFCFPPGISRAACWHWELNWASAPRHALFDVGGFAEEHDALFYSCDNVTVATVAEHLGYQFVVDRDNVCRAVDHAEIFPRPADWEERHGRFGPWEAWHRQWVAQGRPRFRHLSAQGSAGRCRGQPSADGVPPELGQDVVEVGDRDPAPVVAGAVVDEEGPVLHRRS